MMMARSMLALDGVGVNVGVNVGSGVDVLVAVKTRVGVNVAALVGGMDVSEGVSLGAM